MNCTTMNTKDIRKQLRYLLSLPGENEVVEFKEANKSLDFNDIGEYFSALSNEANLLDKSSSWLLFGVRNDKTIVGTKYRTDKQSLDSLKHEIANHTINRISFVQIHEVIINNKRVLLFEIPPAPKGIPVSWKGHFYAREGESLCPLNIEKIDRIRAQAVREDWSMGICEGATMDDLSEEAIAKARESYIRKNPGKQVEVESWSDISFLNKAKVLIGGKVTRAAILLLGKPESESFISPAVSKISWILKDKDNIERDYQHFSCPLILSVDEVYKKIRNLKYRYIVDGTLFPEEVDRYDPVTIREALNNCIAHQDYTLGGKINVVENEDDSLVFSNVGSFIPQTIGNVIDADSPSEYYRNRFLADAMVNLNMIDTVGSGIKKMFFSQRRRFFPMPEYDLSNEKVKLTIIGKVLDIKYARKLAQIPDLSLTTIILLDKVQKKKKLSSNELSKLRKQELIEGRSPNVYVSSKVADVTGQKSSYIKNRGFKDAYYKKMIIEYLEKYAHASKLDIDNLLLDILPNVLNESQRKNKVRNIVYAMSRKDKTITNTGTKRIPKWKKV